MKHAGKVRKDILIFLISIFLFFRSNASTNGNSSTNSSSGSSEQGRFFYSLYDFEATDTTMISTQRGQVVRVVSTIFHLPTFIKQLS